MNAPVAEPAVRHSVVAYCDGEICSVEHCETPAAHRVEEIVEYAAFGYSAYLCCEHFGYIMGKLARMRCDGMWGGP